MVGKDKKPMIEYQFSDSEFSSPVLGRVLAEFEDVCYHTHLGTNTTISLNYKRLERSSDGDDDDLSTIAMPRSSALQGH